MSEFAKTLEMFNLSPLDARLFVYMYLIHQPLTLDNMSEALGKSKTTVNKSARNLHKAHLISLVWKKGVRKDLYEANSDLFRLFMTPFLKQSYHTTKEQKETITQLEDLLKDSHPFLANDASKQKVQEIIDFHIELEEFFQNIMIKE